jgi:integrase
MRREITHYVKKLEAEGLTRRYIGDARRTLLHFLVHCRGYGIRNSKAITAEAVLDYLVSFERFSAPYQRHTATVLRRFLAFGENAVMVNMRVRIRGNARTRVDWLTPGETELVLATPMTPTEAVLVRAGLLQGMRRIETLRLTVQDAKNALSSIILVVRGKDNKLREIPLHLGFAEALRAYFEKHPQLDGVGPLLGIQRSRSERVLKDFCNRFGKKFGFHTLRRTFGRNLWLRGIPIETISELLGHVSTDMTRLYLGLNITDMRKAISEYGTKSELKIIEELPQRRIAPPRKDSNNAVTIEIQPNSVKPNGGLEPPQPCDSGISVTDAADCQEKRL